MVDPTGHPAATLTSCGPPLRPVQRVFVGGDVVCKHRDEALLSLVWAPSSLVLFELSGPKESLFLNVCAPARPHGVCQGSPCLRRKAGKGEKAFFLELFPPEIELYTPTT